MLQRALLLKPREERGNVNALLPRDREQLVHELPVPVEDAPPAGRHNDADARAVPRDERVIERAALYLLHEVVKPAAEVRYADHFLAWRVVNAIEPGSTRSKRVCISGCLRGCSRVRRFSNTRMATGSFAGERGNTGRKTRPAGLPPVTG